MLYLVIIVYNSDIEICDLNHAMNILDTLKPSQMKLLKIKHLEKGEVLFRENDKCNCIGIVIYGQISIVTYLDDGNEIVFNTLKENGVFGNNLIFSSSPYYKGNIITNVSSKIALIQKKDLMVLLKTNEAFMIEYLNIQSDFTKILNNKIKLLSIDSAEERLMFYMHENANEIEYNSISSLAKQLFLQRETLSRLLSRLEKQNRIIKKDNTLKIK